MKLRTFERLYDELNSSTFAGVLSCARIMHTRSIRDYAVFDPNTYIISFNTKAISGMLMARSIVYHEMIHQYLDQILNIDEHHGINFWKAYRKFNPGNVILSERF